MYEIGQICSVSQHWLRRYNRLHSSNLGRETSKKYNKSIRNKIQSIARGEDTLQALNVQRANIYQARVNRHLIIFEQSAEEIRIIRVLHEAMDIPRHIKLDS